MKITPTQLGPHLQKTLAKVYLVCGDEPFLAQETINTIKVKAASDGFAEHQRLDIETDKDLEMLHTSAYTPSLLGGKRFTEVQWKGKLTKAGQQFLINYAKTPSAYTILIVKLGRLDSKTEQTVWFKTLEQASVVIAVWPLQPHQFTPWIIERAKKYQLQMTINAAERLAHFVEGNLHAASQEIEKLSLSGYALIDQDVIEAVVADQGTFNAFDLVDQAVAGHANQAIRILHYLQSEGSEPPLILGAFMHEIRTLAKLADELARGAQLNVLFSQYRIRPSKQNGIRDFFKRNNKQTCLNLILAAGQIDQRIKGLVSGNVWEALERFSLAVAGIEFARNSFLKSI